MTGKHELIVRTLGDFTITWQGRITWADRNKTVRFRSILEMIKLIEDGILAEHPELLEEEDTPNWDE